MGGAVVDGDILAVLLVHLAGLAVAGGLGHRAAVLPWPSLRYASALGGLQ